MKKKTAKQRILDHLRDMQTYVSGRYLEELAPSWGFKPSYVGREARRLEEVDKKIDKSFTAEGYVQYISKEAPKPIPKRIQIITKPDGTQVAQYV